MRSLILAIITALSVCGAGWAQSGDPAIRGVIQQQLDAFRNGDFKTAFSFASPSIQGMFDTPERFGQMVREGYPMVWRPGDVEFLEQAEIGGETWQKVEIRDRSGTLHYLAYRMIRTGDGGWKINGVQRVEAPEVGV